MTSTASSAAWARIRRSLLRAPRVVALAKRVYRWPWLHRTRAFRRFIQRRVSRADVALDSRPPRLTIETVLTCNARCGMCVHSERRMVGTMSMDLFRRLVDEAAAWGVPSLCLSLYGEPLVDKHWLARVRYVREAGLTYGFFSNASMLTDEIATAMLELGGWTEVNFSVNGFSPAVYEAVMPPLSRERVYGNIERFLARKRERGADGPKVTVSCVTLSENVHELPQFVRYWQPRVDRVSIADRTDWLGELRKTDRAQGVRGRLRVLDDARWRTPCPTPWEAIFVYADGRVSPCCEDAAARKLILGDTNHASLREIFHGPAYVALREQHRSGARERHAICGSCSVNWPWL